MNHTATYSPEDNKLRIYPACRLDAETYARVKAAGFHWAPKQELFVAPAWTPQREDLALELCGEIGDEDTSLVERAEAKAERLEDLSDRRAADGDRAEAGVKAIADNIPFGQPILVGHHSEKRARKDAEKIQNGMRKAVDMWKASEYWKDRARGALRLAKYKERPDVRARRLKGLEADKRKQERSQAEATKFLKAYEDPDALTATLRDGSKLLPRLLATYEGGLSFENQRRFEREEISFDEALAMATASLRAIVEGRQRWIDHLTNRVTYERAMLDEAGGAVAERTGPEKGGAVRCWCSPRGGGWSYIQKVNKVTVTVLDNWNNGGKNFTRTIPFTDLRGVMTAAQVQAAKDADRLRDTHDGIGFVLLDAPAPAPRDPKPAGETREKIEAMQESLSAGVKVVTAPQLFPTPAELAARMVDVANISPAHRVLEPSAGTGNILKALNNRADIHAVEINRELCDILRPLGLGFVYNENFLEQNGNLGTFDRILMNPPFVNGADIKHIQHALHMLKPGGRLVAICANGSRQQSTLKPLAEDSGGWWEDLPAGTFADQGTNVNTALLVIEGAEVAEVVVQPAGAQLDLFGGAA